MTLEIRNLAQGTGWTAHPTDTFAERNSTTMPTTRDYFDHDDAPLVCGDCARPAYWDETDANYHHAIDASRGCFLIPADDRPDDIDHPLVAVPGTTWIRTR